MRLVSKSAPYIRKSVSVSRMMLDVIIALLPVTIFAMIQNGWGGIYVFLISLAIMVFFELLIHMFMHWPSGMKFKELFSKEGFAKVKESYTINNILAPVISGLIFALNMPANCSPYVIIVGAAFGMIVGKMLFGGLGQNIINPAAAGRIFATICFDWWPRAMPVVFQELIFGTSSPQTLIYRVLYAPSDLVRADKSTLNKKQAR